MAAGLTVVRVMAAILTIARVMAAEVKADVSVNNHRDL